MCRAGPREGIDTCTTYGSIYHVGTDKPGSSYINRARVWPTLASKSTGACGLRVRAPRPAQDTGVRRQARRWRSPSASPASHVPPRHHTNPTITVSMVRSDGISPPVSVGSPEKPSQPTQQASTQPVDGDVSPSFTCTKSPPKSALCIISASTHRLAPNLPRAPLRPRPPPPPTITSSTSPTTSLTSDQLLFPPLLPPRSPAIACRS